MASPFVEPAPKHRDDGCGEGSDPLLASFADAADTRSDAEMDVGFLKRDQRSFPNFLNSRGGRNNEGSGA